MTVARVESPCKWRLQRADGAFVAALRTADGLVDRFVIGVGERVILAWRGREYQEAMWGSATDAGDSLLLVGHVQGGYVSAALTLAADGLTMEFADRVAAVAETPLGVLQGFAAAAGSHRETLGDPSAHVKIDREGRVSVVAEPRTKADFGIVFSIRIEFAGDEVRAVRVV